MMAAERAGPGRSGGVTRGEYAGAIFKYRPVCDTRPPVLLVTLGELTEAVARGSVDTVLLAMTDMQGRPQGKRVMATHFLE